jgi:hypothetical protein
MAEQKPWFVQVAEWFYDGWNMAQFVGSLGLGTAASYVHLDGNTPAAPWLLLLTAFFVGWLVVWVIRGLWRWVHVALDRPAPQLEILSSGTRKAVLEVAHFGAPLTYSGEGRVVQLVKETDQPKPPEQRFILELQPEEGRGNASRLRLKDGEWAHIVLAEVQRASRDDDGQVLWIRRGSYGRRAQAPDSGVEMEFIIKTEPSYPTASIKRRIRITREGLAVKAVFVGD